MGIYFEWNGVRLDLHRDYLLSNTSIFKHIANLFTVNCASIPESDLE